MFAHFPAQRAGEFAFLRQLRFRAIRFLAKIDLYLGDVGERPVPPQREDVAFAPVQIGGEPVDEAAPPVIVEPPPTLRIAGYAFFS